MWVLGVRIDLPDVRAAIQQIQRWIDLRESGHFVTLTNVNNVMECQRTPEYMRCSNAASLSLPDGMPIVWVGALRGIKAQRIAGPDFMIDFMAQTASRSLRHFFYGGREEVVQKLTQEVKKRFPNLEIAGYYSPPFRKLTDEEDRNVVKLINDSKPDVLWVGLGCPKQELWMYGHRNVLSVPVMLAVGQAFDIHAGCLRRAPQWMRENGLEWLFRLLSEPRRLWRRYLVHGTTFAWKMLFEHRGVRKAAF
jgi:N-acetylglucosaminyldiphosphoundecaprenol N-acetyl-beta-D-mannosaminyltransferase